MEEIKECVGKKDRVSNDWSQYSLPWLSWSLNEQSNFPNHLFTSRAKTLMVFKSTIFLPEKAYTNFFHRCQTGPCEWFQEWLWNFFTYHRFHSDQFDLIATWKSILNSKTRPKPQKRNQTHVPNWESFALPSYTKQERVRFKLSDICKSWDYIFNLQGTIENISKAISGQKLLLTFKCNSFHNAVIVNIKIWMEHDLPSTSVGRALLKSTAYLFQEYGMKIKCKIESRKVVKGANKLQYREF